MQWPSLTQDEQQELWNTLEVLMHGATAAEVRSAQQRLATMTSRQRPYLSPEASQLLDQVIQAATCASHGGEQRFYWLSEVDNRWKALIETFSPVILTYNTSVRPEPVEGRVSAPDEGPSTSSGRTGFGEFRPGSPSSRTGELSGSVVHFHRSS